MKAAGLGVEVEGPDQVAATLRHPVSMLVNALGPAARVRGRGGARQGRARRRALREPAARGAQHRARRRRVDRAGHRSRRSTAARSRRWCSCPEVVDTVGPDVPGARRRRHRPRPADGGRDGARRAGRVDGLDLARRRGVGRGAVGRREPARGRLQRHGALAFDDRQARAPVAHGVDRGVGTRGGARSRCRCRCRESSTRRPRTASCAPARRRCRVRRSVRSSAASTGCGRRRDVVFDIIDEYVDTLQRMTSALDVETS